MKVKKDKLALLEKKRLDYITKQRNRIKNKDISVIASNCNGAFILHDLGIRFNSPFVNLWIKPIKPKDYIKLLKNYDRYMIADLSETYENGISYPIGKLDDVSIYFQHYNSFEQAKEKWDERKELIKLIYLFCLQIEMVAHTRI